MSLKTFAAFWACVEISYAFKEYSVGDDPIVDPDSGIWTGYDWTDSIAGVGVKDGVPYGLTPETD